MIEFEARLEPASTWLLKLFGRDNGLGPEPKFSLTFLDNGFGFAKLFSLTGLLLLIPLLVDGFEKLLDGFGGSLGLMKSVADAS